MSFPSPARRTAVAVCLAAGLLTACGAHHEARAPKVTTTTSTSTTTTTTSTTTTTVPAPAPPRVHHHRRHKRKRVKAKVHSSFRILPPFGTTTTTEP